jgi:hypothetical protein
MMRLKTRIKKIFQQHIKNGGMITSPDKLIEELIGVLDSSYKKVGIHVWVVNDELYYSSKPEALDEMMEGDSLSREYHEAGSLRTLVCKLRNNEPTMVDQEVIIKSYNPTKRRTN